MIKAFRDAVLSAVDFCAGEDKNVKKLPPDKRYIESDLVKAFEKFVAEKKKK